MNKKHSIVGSTIVISLISFIIKLLGLVKQAVLASICGATDDTDIFFIVTGVLVSISIMIFSAISVTLLAIHTDTLIKDGRERANDLINAILRFFIPISILISLFFIVGAPLISKILAPTYDSIQISIMSKYIRQMSVIFVLWCYFSTINVILETDKEFIPGRGQNFFQNVFLIISAIFFFKQNSIDSLIAAFILSGIAECILVTICARKKFKIVWGHLQTPKRDVIYLLRLSGTLLIGNAVYEMNDIVDKQISSGLGSGNVSYLTYGGTINEIITGVVVTAIATVTFSHFATWVSHGEIERLNNNLKKCIEYMWMLIYPIMSLCIFAGDDMVKLFYGHGNFSEYDTRYTYFVAIGYACGFLFASARSVLVRVFYAFKDTKMPLQNGIISVISNILMSILLSKIFGVWGISLSTSIAMLLSLLIMLKQIKVYLPSFNLHSSNNELLKGLLGFLTCSICVFILNKILELPIFLKILIETTICFSVYSITLFIFNSKTLNQIIKIFLPNEH